MEIQIKIDNHTVVYATGINIRATWMNAMAGFNDWIKRYISWSPKRRKSAGLPSNWEWN